MSTQLHLEAMASALTRVYAFGPVFRADPSNTANHLAEFWMLEPEMAFAGLDDAVQLAEHLVASSVRALLACPDRQRDLDTLESLRGDEQQKEQQKGGALAQRLEGCLRPFARMSYTEAVGVLGLEWGAELERQHERALCEVHCGGRPLFLTDYPAAVKPFYMRRNAADARGRETVACMDLLLPGLGEVAGGSAREERHDVLRQRMQEALPAQAQRRLQWYLELRKYGSVPHAGFGIGFDRLVQYVCGIENIRDVIPFPRTKSRCDL